MSMTSSRPHTHGTSFARSFFLFTRARRCLATGSTRDLQQSVAAHRLGLAGVSQRPVREAHCLSDTTMAAGADYYKVLGVTKTSSEDEIKKARTQCATPRDSEALPGAPVSHDTAE
jgi:hypothetical protein